jgi:hypothetical protein
MGLAKAKVFTEEGNLLGVFGITKLVKLLHPICDFLTMFLFDCGEELCSVT